MPAIVIVIVLSTWIVVLYDGRHNPCWSLAEVYDDSQPAVGLDVLAVKALPIGSRVQGAMIGPCDRPHDHVDMIE
jgi:hypothetical protein